MLTIDVEKTGDVAVVRCVGRIVRGAGIRTLRNAVFSEKEIRIVVIDLSDVETLDAGGLTALLSLQQWAGNRKVQLKLVNPSHFVNEMLTRTGLDHVFDISTFERALFVLGAPDCRHSKYAAVC
jgi:anti-anti-sigma factor